MFSKSFYHFGNIIAKSMGDLPKVIKRLESERDFTSVAVEKDDVNQSIEYCWKLYPNINHRCSALLGHISIMLGLSIFVLRHAQETGEKLLLYAGIADVFLYVFLLSLSLRTVRSFGLDKDIDDSAMYAKEFFYEIAIKFSLVGLINTFTAIGMVYTLILLVKIYF